jgi:hypothetical protein
VTEALGCQVRLEKGNIPGKRQLNTKSGGFLSEFRRWEAQSQIRKEKMMLERLEGARL